jgi:hypothetical protein
MSKLKAGDIVKDDGHIFLYVGGCKGTDGTEVLGEFAWIILSDWDELMGAPGEMYTGDPTGREVFICNLFEEASK